MKIVYAIFLASLMFSCADKKLDSSGMPTCLTSMIEKQKKEMAEPESVTQYAYKGQTVYYVVAPCCDQFNNVYDSDCKFLGSPDGGMEGRGDHKLPEFFSQATDKKVVWQKK